MFYLTFRIYLYSLQSVEINASTFLRFLISTIFLINFLAVPIIPEFLYDIRHPDAPLSSFSKYPPPMLKPPDNDDLTGEYTTIAFGEKFEIFRFDSQLTDHEQHQTILVG